MKSLSQILRLGTAIAAFALVASPAWASVDAPNQLQITLHYAMTSNTCDFATATPPAATVAGSSISQITNGTAALEEVNVQLSDCAAAAPGIKNPAIKFDAQGGQYQGMALVDQKGTGAGFLLYQDAYGQTSINPVGGDTVSVPSKNGNVAVPFWVKLTKVGGTLRAGAVEAKAMVEVDYP